MNEPTGNKEIAICENCGKEYLKRKYIAKGRASKIRGMNTKNCSKKCSKEILKTRRARKIMENIRKTSVGKR